MSGADEEIAALHHDVACPVCGCVCDDLVLRTTGANIEPVSGSCVLSDRWFAALNAARPPVALVSGEPTAWRDAVEQAATILSQSSAPLVYGLSGTNTDAQRVAVGVAERLGAVIDTTASVCHAPSIVAIQSVGESTSSLGEVRHRSDVVIYWGADPETSHPRHRQRYTRSDAEVIVIDVTETATARTADRFLQVDPESDFELIFRLRKLIAAPPPAVLPTWEENPEGWLAERLRGANYSAIFFGLGLAQRSLGHLTVEVLLRMVAELNAVSRCVARRLRIPGDVTGADSVLCWQTGYPFSVSLSRPFPRYNPGEFSAPQLLSGREVDAALIIGSESLREFPDDARAYLENIPTIVLDDPHAESLITPDILIRTAAAGVHTRGSVYRMDEVPVPLRRVSASDYPTDAEVLIALGDVIGRE